MARRESVLRAPPVGHPLQKPMPWCQRTIVKFRPSCQQWDVMGRLWYMMQLAVPKICMDGYVGVLIYGLWWFLSCRLPLTRKPRGSRFWSDLEVLIKQDWNCGHWDSEIRFFGSARVVKNMGKPRAKTMMIERPNMVLWCRSHRMFLPGSKMAHLCPHFFGCNIEPHTSRGQTVLPLIFLSPFMGQYSLNTVLTCSEIVWYSLIDIFTTLTLHLIVSTYRPTRRCSYMHINRYVNSR